MKLKKEEKQLLINSKDENDWYKICDDIKARRFSRKNSLPCLAGNAA